MSSHRYIVFWPQDWVNEVTLHACSLAARGLWMDLICLAHSGDPYGHLASNGRPMTPEWIAKSLRMNPRTIRKLIRELEENGVFSRTNEGIIYCRRMVRDAEKSQQGQEFAFRRWGRKSGKPPNGSGNGSGNGQPNAHIQNQISKSNSNSNAREDAPREDFKNSVFKKERVDRSGDEPVSDSPEVNRVIAFTAKALTMKRPYGEVRTKNQQLEALDDERQRPRPKPAYLTREQLALARKLGR